METFECLAFCLALGCLQTTGYEYRHAEAHNHGAHGRGGVERVAHEATEALAISSPSYTWNDLQESY